MEPKKIAGIQPGRSVVVCRPNLHSRIGDVPSFGLFGALSRSETKAIP